MKTVQYWSILHRESLLTLAVIDLQHITLSRVNLNTKWCTHFLIVGCIRCLPSCIRHTWKLTSWLRKSSWHFLPWLAERVSLEYCFTLECMPLGINQSLSVVVDICLLGILGEFYERLWMGDITWTFKLVDNHEQAIPRIGSKQASGNKHIVILRTVEVSVTFRRCLKPISLTLPSFPL